VVIRNGIKLYEGRTDEMTSSNGFFDLKSDNDQEKLKGLLENYDGISSVKEEEGLLIAVLTKDISATEINEYLFKNKISLSHLVKRKLSLEQQFLTLTNDK
jgi:ABC-2 type transport system ATP-binding protein